MVKASAESRRAVLGGFLAGAAMTLSNAAFAAGGATPVDIFDDRKVREKGFDLIYEARDLDIPQAERDGLTQARANLELTKKRIKEAETRIDGSVAKYTAKSYWTEAREELRRQVGTLRFDLNALAEIQPKDKRKTAQALNKEFLTKVEDLDLALRKKDLQSATTKLTAVQTALDQVIASVL